MNESRRNKQISDKEINAFKEREINIILNQTKTLKENSLFRRPAILGSTFVLTTLLIIISIFIIHQPEDKLDYTVTKLSYNEYLMESEVDNNKFNLYYKTSVIQPGQRTTFNDTFDYYTPYTYASDEIAKQYEVDFNVFKLSPIRYFLENNFNNESTYIEVNYYPHHGLTWNLVGLEIDDLEKDISDIYELIDLYPPQFDQMNLSVPMYLRHPDIDLLEDSKAKRNYIQYVENNLYVPQNYFSDSDLDIGDDTKTTISIRQMIIVNEQGEYINSEIYENYSIRDDFTFIEYLPDYSFGAFSFYLTGEDEPFEKMEGSLNTKPNNEDADVSGYYKVGSYQQKLYLYAYISQVYSNVDLSEAHRGEIDYTLSQDFEYEEGSFEFEFLDYDHGLVMPPFIISDDINISNNIDIFDSLTYRFYDINGTLICEFNK